MARKDKKKLPNNIGIKHTPKLIPENATQVESDTNKKILFCFDKFDKWKWYSDNYKIRPFIDICENIKSSGCRTWGQVAINKKRDHSCTISSLSKNAQNRLKYLKLEDQDELFSFRLSGTNRVWGIRDSGGSGVFYVLWWDPLHMVCPV